MAAERSEIGFCYRCGWQKDHHRDGCTELVPRGIEKEQAEQQWQQGNAAALKDNDSYRSTGKRPGETASIDLYYQLGYLMGKVEKY